MYKRCPVCKGSQSLWGTPKLLEERGIQPLDLTKAPQVTERPSDSNYGLSVTCWKCLGRGYIPGYN